MLRYFDVLPTNNSNLAATLVFKYFDSELNGNYEDLLESYYSTDDGDTWNYLGSSATNTSLNTLTVSGVNTMSRFTISNPGNIVLPLKALYLRISASSQSDAVLTWQADELHPGDRFVIERSLNGVRFSPIGQTSVGIRPASDFQYSDQPIGNAYYRVQLITALGETLYSYIVLYHNDNPINMLRIAPNPMRQQATLHYV